MPMKNPPHPGELVAAELEELGDSIAEAAEATGVSRQHLTNVVAGRSGISADMALRLEKSIGSAADFWLRLQQSYELAQARLRGEPDVKKLTPRAA